MSGEKLLVDRTTVEILREHARTGKQSTSDSTQYIMLGIELALDLLKLPKGTNENHKSEE